MFIDHITVAGPDLDELRACLAAAGVSSEYGGVHGNGITHMALAGFSDGSYLEIVAPVREDGRVALWHDFHLPRKGGAAWTVASDDIVQEFTHAQALGIQTRGPVMIRREKPDGQIGQWHLGYLESHQPGGALPFLIHDITDRSLRVRKAADAKGVLAGWGSVILAVREPQATAPLFQKVYGWDAPLPVGELLHFAGTPIYLSSPANHLDEFGESPCACTLRPTGAASLANLRFSAVSSLAGKTVHWLDLPWKNIRIGVEDVQ